MRSLAFLTALALVSVQLVSSAPPNWDAEEKRDVVWVTDIATRTKYVFTTDIVTKARDAPHFMHGNNPWNNKHNGPVDHNPNKPGTQKKPAPKDSNPNKPGIQHGPPARAGDHQPKNKDDSKKPKPGPQPGKNMKNRLKAGNNSGTKPTGQGYQAEVLQCHNVHRSNHSAPALTWSPSLASTAQKIASTCNYGHSMNIDGGGYGQNIAAGVGPGNIAKIISDMFYNHELPAFGDQYGVANPTGFEKWGHFSQVVWKKTSEVGCHTCDCSKKGGLKNVGGNVAPWFTVCNYKSPGNVAGQYGQNIGRPLGRPTVGH